MREVGALFEKAITGRHNVFQDQENINGCESMENVLHRGLCYFVGITQLVWGYWGCIQVLTLVTHSLP